MNRTPAARRADLVRIATESMAERGLEPEFPAGVARQLATITGPGRDTDERLQDLTALPWCSIDSDDSRDLDRLSACESLPDGVAKAFIALVGIGPRVRVKRMATDVERGFIDSVRVD